MLDNNRQSQIKKTYLIQEPYVFDTECTLETRVGNGGKIEKKKHCTSYTIKVNFC